MAEDDASSPSSYEGMTGEGSDMSRILSLSDGVFGFSMTLLVINLALPTVTQSGSTTSIASYLAQLEPHMLDYALAFIVVGSWWGEHHRIFSVIRRYDSALMRLNIWFLLLISVTPFILALVFTYGPNGFTDRSASAVIAVVLFGGVEVFTGLALWAIWHHSTTGHRLVDPHLPAEWIRFAEGQSLRRIGVFAVSIAVGLVLPLFAEFIWLGSIFGRTWRRKPPPVPPPPTALPSDPTRSTG